jgi:citrate lyase beta subunit
VVVDLEDAVALDRKDDARKQVEALEPPEHGLLAVRVNAVGTEWFERDVSACAGSPAVTSIVVPKVESAADIAALSGVPLGIQALIESPAGVVNVQSIAAASPRLETLIIGYADLAASTGRRPHAS